MKNFKPDVIKFKKPESEWTEEEHTEYTKWSLKLSMAHRFKQQIQENKPLTNRDKRIIERFRSGADFFGEKICGKETLWCRNPKRNTLHRIFPISIFQCKV